MTRACAFGSIAAVVAGCSSSVTVQDVSGAGGSGGATTGASTAASGGSVPVDPELACAKLVQNGALEWLPTLANATADSVKLHVLAGGKLAVAYRAYFNATMQEKLASTAIDWTGAWPPSAAAPVVLHEPSLSVMSRTSELGLLVDVSPSDVGVAFGVADAQAGGFKPYFTADPDAYAPTLLADDGHGNYFAGMVAAGKGVNTHSLHVGIVATKPGGASYTGPIDLGCHAQTVAAGAAAVPGGWLLARATADFVGTPGPTLEGDDCWAQAKMIRVTRLSGADAKPAAEIAAGATIFALQLLRRSNGAWLLERHADHPVQAYRLAGDGSLEAGPIAVPSTPPPLSTPTAFAADRAGRGFIVAIGEAPVTPQAGLTLAVDDEQGVTIAKGRLAPVPGASFVAIAFDDTTRQALVALAMPDASGASAVGVARFACQ